MTRSRPRATAPRAPALALALLLAACGGDGGTGPGPTKLANPLATAARIRRLDASFTSPAFQSFSFASGFAPTPITPVSPLAALRSALRSAGPVLDGHAAISSTESRLAAAALRAALVGASGTAAAIIPPGLRGKTYEWNGAQYHVTARPGAPANGVRFILYAPDPGGAPIAPTQEIGYADLQDESTVGTDRLHILVVGLNPPVTYVDYTITLSATVSSGTATVVGFVTDRTERLDFNATGTANATSFSMDARFDVNADDLHVRLKLGITEPTQTTLKLTLDVSLDLGAEVVTVTGSETFDSSTLTVTGAYTARVNGGIYATVAIASLPPSVGPPSYTGGPGIVLTEDDHAALNAIHEAVATLLTRFVDLIAPVFLIPVAVPVS